MDVPVRVARLRLSPREVALTASAFQTDSTTVSSSLETGDAGTSAGGAAEPFAGSAEAFMASSSGNPHSSSAM